MRIRVAFGPRLVLVFIVILNVIDSLSLILFLRIGQIIHSDLNNYGLQFSPEWATRTWAYSTLFNASVLIAKAFIAIALVSILFYMQAKKESLRSICYPLLTLGAVLYASSLFFLTQLDNVVHRDLYQYGLWFSEAWAVQYWTYLRSILGLIGLATLGTCTCMALIYLSRHKPISISQTQLVCTTLIAAGTVALVLSIALTSSILAFIGLGLLFWGVTLTYIRTEDYTKKILLDAATASSAATLDQIIDELGYKGSPVYLPQRYLENPEEYSAFIPRHNGKRLPTPEQIHEQADRIMIASPEGMLITPLGAELAGLFEKTLQTSFARVDLQWLQQNMPKLIVEDLEIAREFELEITVDKIFAKMKSPALDRPLQSAIACALAKASGKPITLDDQQTTRDGKIVIEYTVITKENR
ncbi:MAG: hypothetical protein WCC63_02345 [Candidatus Bathyarchaeia archaeon]